MKSLASTSIIIVAYKSVSFISFCLNSVSRAKGERAVELIVIDNSPSNELMDFLLRYHPEVKYVHNDQNRGFGAACNKGAIMAQYDRLLFLNPDTIISGVLFDHIDAVIETNKNVGIVSALLLNGKGEILPESSRKKPSLRGALIKAVKKRKKSDYYGEIHTNGVQEIEIASGACMCISKFQFDAIGGFDERFWMYAEDLDISLRILQNEKSNYLITEAPVLHFKGESTSKDSWLYNRHFYKTMSSFVKKYIGEGYTYWDWIVVAVMTTILSLLSFFISVGHSAKKLLADAIVSLFVLFSVQFIWSYLRHGIWDYFGYWDHLGSFLLYISIWIGTMWFGGAYMPRRSSKKVMKYLLTGVLASIVVYSLVPLDWRFSRMVVLASGAMMLLFTYFKLKKRESDIRGKMESVLFVSNDLSPETMDIVERYIKPFQLEKTTDWKDLKIKDIQQMDHVIFDVIQEADPIAIINKIKEAKMYSFLNSETLQIVSSETASTQGRRFDQLSHHHLSQGVYKRQKRILDILISIVVFVPLIVFQIASFKLPKMAVWKAMLKGRLTYVGYDKSNSKRVVSEVMKSLLFCYEEQDGLADKSDKIIQYSLHYSIFDDIYVVGANFLQLLRRMSHG